jgi:hypothetical protein
MSKTRHCPQPREYPGRMRRAGSLSPAAKLDLGDQGRLGEHRFLPLSGTAGSWSCTCRECAEILGVLRLETSSDRADFDLCVRRGEGCQARRGQYGSSRTTLAGGLGDCRETMRSVVAAPGDDPDSLRLDMDCQR